MYILYAKRNHTHNVNQFNFYFLCQYFGRYKITISQITMDLLLFKYMFFPAITDKTFTGLDFTFE